METDCITHRRDEEFEITPESTIINKHIQVFCNGQEITECVSYMRVAGDILMKNLFDVERTEVTKSNEIKKLGKNKTVGGKE